MKTIRRTLALTLATFAAAFALATTAAADEPGNDVVHLKGGGRVRGAVMSEDPVTGVSVQLADGTVRKIAASTVDRVAYGSDAPAQPAAAPVAAPAAVAPAEAAAPAAAPPPAAPPPPAGGFSFEGFGSKDGGDEAEAPRKDWKRARAGASFGLNAGGGYIPGLNAGGALLTLVLNVGVGPIDFRFHGGGYAGGGDFGASLGPMFMTETRFNLGSVYTLAVGGLVSASYDTERDEVEPVVGALLTPAAFRFGPSRQFELALFGGPTYNTQTDWVGGLGGQSFTVLFL